MPSINFLAKALVIFLTAVLLFILSSILSISQVFAQIPPAEGEIIFQDDFSQGFEKWQLIAGNWNMWQIVGEGDQAQALVETRSTITQLIPRDEYWFAETLLNYEYRFEFEPITGADRNIGFGYLDSGNWCEIHFVGAIYQMICINDGVLTLNVTENFTLANGKKYQITIRFEDGRIRVWIDDHLLKDVTDGGFNGEAGRPLLRAGTGSITPTKVRFDNIEVIDLDGTPPIEMPTSLPIPEFSQLDDDWRENEYDTASEWSTNPTIGRWGCALTSMAMILQYYGFDETPDTLNTWLNSQPDGYIGDGLLNWLAVTRLTRELSEELIGESEVLPSLEYSRVATNYSDPDLPDYDEGVEFLQSIQTAFSEISQEQPVILQIPGHFLVGGGGVGGENPQDSTETIVTDLNIFDPFYDYDLLSQHRSAQQPLPLLSTRIFTPSFTDLSYILIVHDPALAIELLDEDGDPVSIPVLDKNGDPISDQFHQVQMYAEQIIDQTSLDAGGDREATAFKLITQLAKPVSGDYQLQVSALETGFYDFEVYLYDDQANPTIYYESDWFLDADENSSFFRKYEINYNKSSSSSLIKTTTWETFYQDLLSFHQAGEITKWYVWDDLERIVGFIQDFLSTEPIPNLDKANIAQNRYINLLTSLLNLYKGKISLEVREYLQAELENLGNFS